MALRTEALALYRQLIRCGLRLPPQRRDEVLFEVRAAFDRNRTAAGTAAVARLLGEGMAHVQRLKTEAASPPAGRQRFVVRKGQLTEVSDGAPERRDSANVRPIWSSDIARRNTALLARQKRLGL
eukprot:TRINITY_DN17268_c0_g1_i1.p1 TRINITY_DN17268_c0_g1~~TRINITY_DN17268_c0_g1_i1.p1  ORF type:complete len:134 (+),score=24.78 TRINITY_DN17268_c0_g1_i1:30-404(+)